MAAGVERAVVASGFEYSAGGHDVLPSAAADADLEYRAIIETVSEESRFKIVPIVKCQPGACRGNYKNGRIELVDGRPAVIVRFELRHAPGVASTIVQAQPLAVLDNGEPEHEPPIGDAVPEVLFWRGPLGIRSGSRVLEIPSEPDGPWEVAVSLPSDAMVAVDLSAHAGAL